MLCWKPYQADALEMLQKHQNLFYLLPLVLCLILVADCRVSSSFDTVLARSCPSSLKFELNERCVSFSSDLELDKISRDLSASKKVLVVYFEDEQNFLLHCAVSNPRFRRCIFRSEADTRASLDRFSKLLAKHGKALASTHSLPRAPVLSGAKSRSPDLRRSFLELHNPLVQWKEKKDKQNKPMLCSWPVNNVPSRWDVFWGTPPAPLIIPYCIFVNEYTRQYENKFLEQMTRMFLLFCFHHLAVHSLSFPFSVVAESVSKSNIHFSPLKNCNGDGLKVRIAFASLPDKVGVTVCFWRATRFNCHLILFVFSVVAGLLYHSQNLRARSSWSCGCASADL